MKVRNVGVEEIFDERDFRDFREFLIVSDRWGDFAVPAAFGNFEAVSAWSRFYFSFIDLADFWKDCDCRLRGDDTSR